MYDFSSYEPIETKIDSAFSSIYRDSLIIIYAYLAKQETENINECVNNVRQAHSTMEIYFDSRSSSGRLRYDRARREAEENLNKAKESLDYMKSLYGLMRERSDTFKKEFIGWQATHRYRAKTRGGHYALGDNLYIFDYRLDNIIHKEDLDDEEIQSLRKIIDEALDSEQ